MSSNISRRRLIETAGVAALATPAARGLTMPEPRYEGKDTPKICLAVGDGGGLGGGVRGGAPGGAAPGAAAGAPPATAPGGGVQAGVPGAGGRGLGGPGAVNETSARRIKQLGVDYVLSGGPRIPWEESRLRAQMDGLKAVGLTLGNLM